MYTYTHIVHTRQLNNITTAIFEWKCQIIINPLTVMFLAIYTYISDEFNDPQIMNINGSETFSIPSLLKN